MKIKISTKISRNFLFGVLGLMLATPLFAVNPPSQVTGVKATLVSDSPTSVQLDWNEATSEEAWVVGYRIYYGKTSVKDTNSFYENDIEFNSDKTSYVVKNLEPGNKYYFAITAFDDEMNQSTNYSEEVFLELPATENTTTEEPVVEEPVIEEPVNEEPAVTEPITEEPIVEEPVVEPEPVEQPTEPVEEPKSSAPMDVFPPVDATNLKIDKKNLENKNQVVLKWKKSANTEGDVKDQVLYVKKNNKWDGGLSLGKDLEETVLDVEKNKKYEAKIVTIDNDGNQSNGAVVKFSTEKLASSGPLSNLSIFIAIGALILLIFSYRKS